MEIKNEHYLEHINTRCKDIFPERLQDIIRELSENAKFYMSSEIDATVTVKINAAIVDMLKNHKYRYLPLHLVGEAFTRGSMGELGGTTRFTVRNVCIWLGQMQEKMESLNALQKTKEDAGRRIDEEKSFRENKERSNLFGTAMYLKIGWCQAGLLSERQYDECSLDKIVGLIEKGYPIKEITPSMIIR
jgi:hypothetical protein